MELWRWNACEFLLVRFPNFFLAAFTHSLKDPRSVLCDLTRINCLRDLRNIGINYQPICNSCSIDTEIFSHLFAVHLEVFFQCLNQDGPLTRKEVLPVFI